MSDNNGHQADNHEESGVPVEELFLMQLRYKEGRLMRINRHRPILLNQKESVWVVYSGIVDVFAVDQRPGRRPRRVFLFTARAGEAIMGIPAAVVDDIGVNLIGIGSVDAQLVMLTREKFRQLAEDPELTDHIFLLLDHWIGRLTAELVNHLPPQDYESLHTTSAKQKQRVTEDKMTLPRRGLLWVKHIEGESHFLGQDDLPKFSPNGYLPLTNRVWLETASESEFDVVDTKQYFDQINDWGGLDKFHRYILHQLIHRFADEEKADYALFESKQRSDKHHTAEAMRELASILNPVGIQEVHGEDNALLAACHYLAAAQGFTISSPFEADQNKTLSDPVEAIARASGVRVRIVAFKGAWWKEDVGPLLGFRKQGKEPVALLPAGRKGYRLINPQQGGEQLVDEAVDEQLKPFGYMFYTPLPDRPLKGIDLLRFAFQGRSADVAVVVLIGILGGLLGMATPWVTGYVVDVVIPMIQTSTLLQLMVLLLAIAVSTTILNGTIALSVMRIESKVDLSLQSAVWDRLVRLPAPFFRKYTIGDLAERAMGITNIRQTLSQTVTRSLVTAIFSSFNLILLFWYSWQLALVGLVLVGLAFVCTAVASVYQIRYQRQVTDTQGEISGLVLQFISGIEKFRIAGVEGRLFNTWAKRFSGQKRTTLEARKSANLLSTFSAVFPIIATMTFFMMIAFAQDLLGGAIAITIGQFVAFLSAFNQFLNSVLQLSTSATSVLQVVPLYERLRPIIENEPESNAGKGDPGELVGEIEVNNINFRYAADGPRVLKDVSFTAKPGEFVALIGPSGSGKSTLLRLLLGFERQESGAIYYDGQDLSRLNLQAVRRQLGVVLQNGKLMGGDLYTNIVGSSQLSVDDAWEAAEKAGVADDIREMPMKMHTAIRQGGGTLSGGQRQRLLIARAIVNKPRILFFDEATSALDNRTQAIVSESLDALRATRIVIAHRLSTIRNADRIVVMDQGSIVEMGSYDELMRQNGLFTELARRQLA